MNHPPRGSAEYVRQILENALGRGKPMVDRMAEMVGASGYPPLTLPLTLKDLQGMTEQQAVARLREELARTTVEDPWTGEKRVQPKTLKLIADYFQWVRDTGGAEALPGGQYG